MALLGVKTDIHTHGRPTKDARLVIGAVIIKHKLYLSDRETVAQIQENPYLQYFVGLPGYQREAPFVPSLFVEIRRRMGQSIFDVFQSAIIDSVEEAKVKRKKVSGEKPDQGDDEPPSASGGGSPAKAQEHEGKLILDATVAPQAIRFPTDLSLLNEAREFSEWIIDELYPQTDGKKKPRTYREKARKAFLVTVKQRRPSGRVRRRGIKQQLRYLRRNLRHIERLLEHWSGGDTHPFTPVVLYRYWMIQQVYAQQREMYWNKSRRCDERIVSISQPYVWPIVRGKLDKPVEFGAKLSMSMNGDGVACVDHLRWDAFHEGGDLKSQVEACRLRHGCYPEVVLGDPAYGTRDNRKYLKSHGIRFAGNSNTLRPSKESYRGKQGSAETTEGKAA